MIEWAWGRREKILFFPDEHLGRNTANKMGIPREEMLVWDPFLPDGGNTPEAIRTRLQVYQRDTAPLVAHYAQRGVMHRVPGAGTIEDIATEIKRLIGR